MNGRIVEVLLVLGSVLVVACGPSRIAGSAGADESAGTGALTGSGGSVGSADATSVAHGSTTDGDGLAGICDHLLVARWHAHDYDRVGDLDGDGVHEYIAVVTPFDEDPETGSWRIIIANADVPQSGDGWLEEKIVQEITFAPGFPVPTNAGTDVEVAGLDDVNGDGLPDVGVGLIVPDADGERARVVVLLGTQEVAAARELSFDGPGDHEWWLEASAPSAYTNNELDPLELGTLGDLDNDGFTETYVRPADKTTLWVVRGRAGAGGATTLGDLAGDQQGYRIRYADTDNPGVLYSVVAAGDIDGNGLQDVAAGVLWVGGTLAMIPSIEPWADRDLRHASDAVRRIIGLPGSWFGVRIHAVGDQDGDGLADLWVNDSSFQGRLFSEPECPATPAENSLYRARGGPVGDVSQYAPENAAGVPLHGDCGLVEVSALGDHDGDGVKDLVMVTVSDGFVWLPDADAAFASDAPLLLGYGRVGDCLHPYDLVGGGATFVPGDARIVSADLDGDGRDDFLTRVDNYAPSPRPRPYAVVPGGPYWAK